MDVRRLLYEDRGLAFRRPAITSAFVSTLTRQVYLAMMRQLFLDSPNSYRTTLRVHSSKAAPICDVSLNTTGSTNPRRLNGLNASTSQECTLKSTHHLPARGIHELHTGLPFPWVKLNPILQQR